MNILTDIIPAGARRYVYALVSLVALVLGALQVAGIDVTTALAVFTFITAATGLTAYANTSGATVDDGAEDFYAEDFREDQELDEA